MNLLKHYTVASGYSPIFAPGEGRLKHLTLGVLRLAAEIDVYVCAGAGLRSRPDDHHWKPGCQRAGRSAVGGVRWAQRRFRG